MGGSYSDLNVYLYSKNANGQPNGKTPSVTSTQRNFEGCCSFEVITHEIKYTPPNSGQNYNVILYDGSSDTSKGNYVFGYYYPKDNNQVVTEVHNYYSVLAPNVPLVVSFKCGSNTYNCYFHRLIKAGWDRAYRISGYTFGPKCTKENLLQEFKKLSLDRKIRFTIGDGNKEIMVYKQVLSGKDYFRLIFLPKGKDSVLGSDYLFAIDFIGNVPKLPRKDVPKAGGLCARDTGHDHDNKYIVKIEHKNKIDPYFLSPFNLQLYDGIMVYFAREGKKPETLCAEKQDDNSMAILLEFIDSKKDKTCLKRKDHDGYWWSQEQVRYNNDKELLDALLEIKSTADRANFVTVILDTRKSYEGLKSFREDAQPTYTKYTHTFEKAKEPNLLFERKNQRISSLTTSTIQAKNVEVYYLKVKDKDDKEPFLIVFDPNGQVPTNNKKAYHFANKYKFEDWKEFTQMNKLEGKLAKIRKQKCLENLNLLRWYVYLILIDQELVPPKEEEKPPPQRPDEYKPPKQPEPLPIPLIVGCVVAGVVVIVSLAVVYGVYWYNTTIKLLT